MVDKMLLICNNLYIETTLQQNKNKVLLEMYDGEIFISRLGDRDMRVCFEGLGNLM